MKTPLKFCFCGSSNGRCKLSNGLIICKTYQDAEEGEIINGYECVKERTLKSAASFKMLGVVK
jgi:hypothetical protein